MKFENIDRTARLELVKAIRKWDTTAEIELPSVWAAENRFLPEGVSNRPGKIDHSLAPHMVEIMDCFHPDSGIKSVTVMKSTQSLATTTIESDIGWAIKNKMHNILYIISSKNIAKMRSSAAIDVLIDNSGLKDYVKPISQRMKRKTADNTFYKEFAGGRRLMMTSYNSIADAKSFSWDFIIMDELEEAPYDLKGQGDPEKIFEGRGTTARHLKIAKISTPTVAGGRIHANFLAGDQRFYNVPCPHCGEKQILKIKAMGRDYGLTGRSEKSQGVEQIIPESVVYICQFCHKEIFEYQKQDMLNGGVWIPTARPVNPAYRSYHISNLMSPIMFYTWRQVMQAFCETDWGQKITKFKNFCIDILGEPWENRTEHKTWATLKEHALSYHLGEELPVGAVIVTAGVDVQKDRLELHAVAWGNNMSSWTVDYQVFWGNTADRNSGCWNQLQEYLIGKRFKRNGKEVIILLTAMDSGYNPQNAPGENSTTATQEHIVYDFVARNYQRMIAVRGNAGLHDMLLKEERVKKSSALKIRFDVAVSDIKDEIQVKQELQEDEPGAIHFPAYGLPDEFFKGFASESFVELSPGKFGWKKIYERNEPLDTYIYARAAAEHLGLPKYTEANWTELERKIFS